jgi:probable F420-dependent oxidoreductase
MDRWRPFRFGVIGEAITTREGLLDTAHRAEELGYSTLLLRDHFVAEPFGDQLAPLVALMAIAGATRTLRVGSLVLDNDYRHPVVLAKEAATLDLLSEGRLELGIGAGWLRDEYDRAGIPFEDPAVRVGRLEESLQVLKGLLAGPGLTFKGEHYTVDGIAGFPPLSSGPTPRSWSAPAADECSGSPVGRPTSSASCPGRCPRGRSPGTCPSGHPSASLARWTGSGRPPSSGPARSS